MHIPRIIIINANIFLYLTLYKEMMFEITLTQFLYKI